MLYVSLFVLSERMEGRAIAAFPHDAPKSRDQLRSGRAQLIVMMRRQFAEDLLPFGRKRQQHFAAIVLSTSAVDKSPRLEAVHQLHGAVVADLHAIRQFANQRANSSRRSLYRQDELVLAALPTGALHHLLAEVKEAANLVTELRQRLVVRQGELLHAADCIVLRSSNSLIVYRKTIYMKGWRS